jgi:hypothetical protein
MGWLIREHAVKYGAIRTRGVTGEMAQQHCESGYWKRSGIDVKKKVKYFCEYGARGWTYLQLLEW